MEQITEINIKKIIPNSLQPRKDFDKKKIKELAESIKEVGLINPIQVKKISDSDDKYEIICGERRFRAYKFLKLKKIKAIVKTYKKGKDEMIESLVENLQRDNLTSVEKENYIATLWELGKFKSYRELGKKIGIGEGNVGTNLTAKRLRDKLNIPKDISTRVIADFRILEKNDKIKLLKKIKNKEIDKSKVREYSKIIKKSSDDIKESLFKNEINIKQAKQISKIENPKIKKEVIKAHKEIKKIDNDIEKQLLKKVKNKNHNNLVKIDELNNSFRGNIIELQNKNQTTIRSFLNCINLVNLMDSNQLTRLKYNSELLETNINNMLEVLEKINNKITKINSEN